MPVFQSGVSGVFRQPVGGKSICIFPSTTNIQILAKVFSVNEPLSAAEEIGPCDKNLDSCNIGSPFLGVQRLFLEPISSIASVLTSSAGCAWRFIFLSIKYLLSGIQKHSLSRKSSIAEFWPIVSQ